MDATKIIEQTTFDNTVKNPIYANDKRTDSSTALVSFTGFWIKASLDLQLVNKVSESQV